MQYFYSFVSQVCHCWCPHFYSFVPQACDWWCPPFSAISIHLSRRSITAGVRPFTLAIYHFYAFVSEACHCQCPPLCAGHAAFLFISQVRYCWCPPWSVGHAAFSAHVSPRPVTGSVPSSPGHLFFCLLGLSRVYPCLLPMKYFYSFISQVRHCWCHVAFLFICLSGLLLVVSALFRWP